VFAGSPVGSAGTSNDACAAGAAAAVAPAPSAPSAMPPPLGSVGGAGAGAVPLLPQQHPGPATTLLVSPYEREILQVAHFPSKVCD